MMFDINSKDIICISYPSGGFGTFLYHVLSVFAKETTKFNDTEFKFSKTGDSHSIKKYNNVYVNDPNNYDSDIIVNHIDKKILVLCDNGINNDRYDKINKTFTNATIVRLSISLAARPIVYSTCVIKAQQSELITENFNQVKNNWSDSNELFASRENFTLLYHNWPFEWNINTASNVINVDIEELIIDSYNTICNLISVLNLTLINNKHLKDVIDQWQTANKKYFNIYKQTNDILNAIKNNNNLNISHITELHDQGYINYCIERDFNVIIPVYDYKDWFKSTNEIKELIEKLCLE